MRGLWGLLFAGLAFGVLLLVWLPGLVRHRVAHLFDERLGLHAEVEDVAVGLGDVSLTRLRLSSPLGQGVAVEVARVRVHAGLLAALLRGSSAVESVDVDGVDASIDRASPAAVDLLARLQRKHDQEADDGARGRPARGLHASGAKLVVRDGQREQLRCAGVRVDAGGAQAHVVLDSVLLQRDRVAASLRGVDLQAERADGWKLSKLDVALAQVTFEEPEPTPAATPEPSEDDDDEPVEASASGATKVGLKGEEKPEPKANLPGGPVRHEQSPWARLMTHLQAGATLSLRDATVMRSSASARSVILQGVRAQVIVTSEREAHVTMHGAADGGGHLDVDLRVWPVDLRADGTVALQALPLTLLSPLLPQVPWYEPQQSRIDAELSVKAESLARVALSGRAVLAHAAIFSPKVAPLPVRDVTISLEGKGAWLPVQRRLEVSEGKLVSGKASIAVHGAFELAPDHYLLEGEATLPATKCTDAVRSIPADLLADLAVAEWTGTLAGHVGLRVDSRELQKTVLDVDVKDQCEFASLPAMADLRRFAGPFTHSVLEPDDSVFELETGPGTDAWTPIEAISPFLIHAVLAHEDPGFFNHHGFSLLHVRQALVRNLEAGRYVVGASTITMQLVKNVFLRREKTMARKLQEVLLTWWLERAMDKHDILQLYLNVIEYGPSIYGIRNAARHYFNRLPSELSPAESVFLSTILPNPKRYHSFFEHGALTPGWQALMRKQMQRMQQRGVYSSESVAYGMAEIDAFKFVPEGTAAAPRIIPGEAAALPFEAAVPSEKEPDEGGETFDAPPDGYE